MRKQLRAKEGQRQTFTGGFVRFGTKSPPRDWWDRYRQTRDTVLLRDVRDTDGRIVADHLWLNYTKELKMLNLKLRTGQLTGQRRELQEGDVIRFDARVQKYEKGYHGRRPGVWKPSGQDFKLSHPTKMELVVTSEQR